MNINPRAVLFWIFCGLVGYLIGDERGAIIGVTASIGWSLAVGFYYSVKNG